MNQDMFQGVSKNSNIDLMRVMCVLNMFIKSLVKIFRKLVYFFKEFCRINLMLFLSKLVSLDLRM